MKPAEEVTADRDQLRRVARGMLSGFVTVLVAEIESRATAIAESVERTGTVSDFGDAHLLRMVAGSVDRAWKIYEEILGPLPLEIGK